MKKKILLVLFLIIVVIQFFHPKKNISGAPAPYPVQAPADVAQIFKTSCYDCHSNNTRYPWYSNIQPVAWWLDGHINKGKRHLNFDTLDSLPADKKVKVLRHIASTVREGDMPLSSYTLIHRYAILNEAQKNRIVQWADSLAGTIHRSQ